MRVGRRSRGSDSPVAHGQHPALGWRGEADRSFEVERFGRSDDQGVQDRVAPQVAAGACVDPVAVGGADRAVVAVDDEGDVDGRRRAWSRSGRGGTARPTPGLVASTGPGCRVPGRRRGRPCTGATGRRWPARAPRSKLRAALTDQLTADLDRVAHLVGVQPVPGLVVGRVVAAVLVGQLHQLGHAPLPRRERRALRTTDEIVLHLCDRRRRPRGLAASANTRA